MQSINFTRRVATLRTLRPSPTSRLPARQFTAASASRAGNTGGGNIATDSGTQQSANSGSETGGSRDHALDKGNDKDPNVQSYESSAAREYVPPYVSRENEGREHFATPFLNLRTGFERWDGITADGDGDAVYERTYADAVRSAKAKDTGGQAVRQADERDSTAKAKKDHPEAPDVVIGMQDERGGKGA